MTIYWNPKGPTVAEEAQERGEPTVRCDQYEVYQDDTLLGTVAEPAEYGMPDDIGGVAPRVVREFVESRLDITAYKADRRTEYVRGTPP